MLSSVLVALSALSLVSAAPIPARSPLAAILKRQSDCADDVASATINFPAGQTALAIPAGQSILTIAVGRGTQNYTCSSAGTWALQGAVATLRDVSCLYSQMDEATFWGMPKNVLASTGNPPDFADSTDPVVEQIDDEGGALGNHYFITEPAGSTPSGNQPKFDWTTDDPADSTQYVTVTKVGTLNDADAANNVAWLQLNSIADQGSFASTVFRVDTAGGQPATTTCTAGDATNVDYAAMYVFTK